MITEGRRYTAHMNAVPVPELVDESVREAADRQREMIDGWLSEQALEANALDEAHHRLNGIAPSLTRLFALSPYAAEACRRDPSCLGWRCLDGRLESNNGRRAAAVARTERAIRQELEAGLESATLANDNWRAREPHELAALRRVRHRELVRILWRDLLLGVALEETLTDLTTLADSCIRVATQWAEASQQARHGKPRGLDGDAQRLIVIGMGKLGGHELNVSSDIDLIYVWPQPGQTDGRRSVDNTEFFQRVAQRLTRLLGKVTEDGFVYRVDTRLRPFGDSGPLVVNFDGLEHYWLTQGRDWERYAMIKARPITGDKAPVAELIRLQTPFVYRRYLDYSAIDSLRDLKRKIARSVRQRSMGDNIKLGAGGIREIEFIAQSFQLVRGGRISRLRQRSLKAVLDALRELDLLADDVVDTLWAAYVFLRRVENGLQSMRDEQTHRLPTDAIDRERLCRMLGFGEWAQLESALVGHREAVSEHFANLFSDGSDAHDDTGQWDVPNAADADAETIHDAIQALVDRHAIELDGHQIELLARVSRGAPYQRLTARAQQRLDRLLPRMLQAVAAETLPAVTLERCLNFVSAVAGRSGYLQVLGDRPVVLRRLVHLFAVSPWLSEFVTRHPIVIDELLDTHQHALPTSAAEVHALVLDETLRLARLDLEQQMDGLRQFRHTRELGIVVAELEGDLALMQVSDQLSWLAEGLVQAVLGLCAQALAERHGWPSAASADDAPGNRVLALIAPRIDSTIGVLAYGKLGGLELGLGSDLDLVFLHAENADRRESDGTRPIDQRQWYARLAQKFVHFMTTLTPAGVLYDIDLRLRPNGNSGLLVSAIDVFERYQRDDAWIWEHQALMRGRLIAGSVSMHHRFDAIRRGVLCTPREPTTVREAVADMRARMREALGNRKPGHMDLKQDAGGIADIEFVVQYLVLAYAATHPELAEFTDNVRVLDMVERAGLLPSEDARCLVQSYLELRGRVHRLALQQAPVVVEMDAQLKGLCDDVTAIRNRVLGPPA